MLFNSIQFLIFFPIVTITYFLIPHRYRWALILTASCYFYMAFIPKYLLILAITITIDYFAGIGLEKYEGRKRKWLLIASILSNIGMLAFFKYFNFANENLTTLANFIGWNYPIKNLAIILPIGLSFHTFQSLSYTIEVYRGRYKAERHFGYLATYVMFYPQLVAGPIERPQNVLPQFHTEHKFDYQRVTDGLKWMAWGMFKKVVIADRMAIFVNPIYDAPNQYGGPALLVATLAFAIQIYCDFSGYSDIALGSAQVMGVKLMKNFNHPYFAKSISEFWNRWHISLSTWFRDYLYIPLGGNRVSRIRWIFNLFITFVVSGFWHGANWTFIIWGALHGLYVVFFGMTGNIWKRISEIVRLSKFPWLERRIAIFSTFSLVSFAWIFFRANSLSDAMTIAQGLFSGWAAFILETKVVVYEGLQTFSSSGFSALVDTLFAIIRPITPEPRSTIIMTLVALALFLVIEIKQFRGDFIKIVNKQPAYVRLVSYAALVTFILIFGTAYTGTQQAFIYFQF
jgi:alginate O-acetyltransferase complex protein AlgI